MAFSVTPTVLDAGVLAPGQSVDLVVSFSGVDPDVSDNATVTFTLGGVSIDVRVDVEVDNPEPIVAGIDVPLALSDQGITVTVPTIDAIGATIRVSRA